MSKNEQKIKFEADVTGFKKNVKEAEKSITTLNATLKLSKAQLAGNGNSVQLLGQRLDELKQKHQQQSVAIENTEKAYQKVVEVFGKDSEEAYKLNKQLTDLKTSQQRTTNEINQLNERLIIQSEKLITAGKKCEEYGVKLTKLGDYVDSIGNKLSILSAVVGAVVGASIKSSISFESAWTGVTKTVDGTEEQLSNLRKGIIDLSKQLPSTTEEIAGVAESAGQLGIETDNILGFSKAMIDLGNSTNLTSDEAATQLARFANIMQMSQKDFDKLGSSIVDLGNHFATTEADIVNMAMRLAGAGKQVGFSEGQVLGLATALSSVGIEAEMGGSAISKAMIKMQNAVELGGGKLQDVLKKTGMSLRSLELMSANNSKDFKALAQSIGLTSTELKNMITAGSNLEDFAKISGKTTEQFKKAWKEDASGALSDFIKGLGDAQNKGESAITMLSEMGLTEVRLRDSLLRAANAGNLFNDALKTGTKAWDENVALANEADKRYATTESQLKMLKNELKASAIALGDDLKPTLIDVMKQAKPFITNIDGLVKSFNRLDDTTKKHVINLGAVAIASGPVLKITGKMISTLGSGAKTIGTVSQAIGFMGKTSTEEFKKADVSVQTLTKAFSLLTSPVGITSLAVSAAVGVIVAETRKAEEETKKSFSNMATSATDFITGIGSANSHLNEFNSTLFASSEEQQKLQEDMNNIQQGITNICKTASDERRGYTQEEITQLDEYFQRLRELNQREIEIQQSVAGAITQQAVSTAETLQGTSEEYKVQAQEWIKTAQDQKNKTIELIEKQTIEEVALLNQRYGNEANMQNEAYVNEYNNIMNNKQSKIDLANDEVSKITEVYANGYLERSNQESGWYSKLQEYNQLIEAENQRNAYNIESYENNMLLDQVNKNVAKQSEQERHQREMAKIWKNMYKDMDESQEQQLGVWLAQVQQTELYGGQIDDKTKNIVDSIIASYDSMPAGTRKAMENAMSPLYEEMEKSEPSLFAKAKGIGEGIISRLKKAFDEHSPSKITRKIMRFAVSPMEDEMEKGKKELFRQADELGRGVTKKLSKLGADTINIPKLQDFRMGQVISSNQIVDNTKTIFTTPNIVFNVQELDEAKLQQCFNFVNKKFGSNY